MATTWEEAAGEARGADDHEAGSGRRCCGVEARTVTVVVVVVALMVRTEQTRHRVSEANRTIR